MIIQIKQSFQKLTTVQLMLIVLMLVIIPVRATTILGMDIDEVANSAVFIFEGEVLTTETRQNPNSGIIATYVTFSVQDVVKGDFNGDTLELKFTGGAFDGRMVQVSGLTIPQLGEQGIYFVEALDRDMVNPLVGWSQGHFLITEDSGTRRISTLDRKPVIDVQAVADIPVTIKKPQLVIEGDGDAAAGVVTVADELQIQRAMTVEQFKSRIRALVE